MQLFGKFGILDGSYSESVGKSPGQTVNNLWSLRLRNSLTGRVDGACPTLECHGTLGFVTGSHSCPPQFVVGSNSEEIEAYKVWQFHDQALMLLISTTLSASAISCVIGSTNAREMWLTLKERFAIITKTSIFLLKTCLYNMKKGSDSIAQYLNHIKDARDQLSCVGVHFTDEDIIILALNGLRAEYNTFRCVMQCLESMLSFREFNVNCLLKK